MAKSVFLEVDASIRDNHLIIIKNQEDEFSTYFKDNSVGQFPPIAIQPIPGFCVKSRDVGGKKVFINFCETDRIPPPRDINEDELIELLNSDEDTGFRVPMSIGSVHTDKDKAGEEVNVCDVAINGTFMKKVQANESLKQFLIAIGFEGYQSKFGATIGPERIALKNKKAMGTLQVHHIQQRDVAHKCDKEMVTPSGSQRSSQDEQKKTNMIQEMGIGKIEPKYRFLRKKGNDKTLFGEFFLPYVTSGNDITLDVGEDRIVLETTRGSYFVDAFHEYHVDRDRSYGEFDVTSKFLTLTMPIITLG